MKHLYICTIKTRLIVLGVLFLIASHAKAQTYVTIPDSNFVKYLQTTYASCMKGDQLDINCTSIKNVELLNLNSKKISDLSGIQYFTSLKSLYCGDNLLKTLPPLSGTKLELLNCNSNLLVALPPLPTTLCSLECSYNKLTYLQPLNPCTVGLMCSNNEITSLPEIPSGMQMLIFDNNKITCLPPLPETTLYMFGASNNPFYCVSNYINMMDSTFKANHPICKENDIVNNPYNCYIPKGIRGYVFKDGDNNCKKTTGDVSSKNVALELYDSTGQLVTKTYSHPDGLYQFFTSSGKYTVKIDTTNMPFKVNCPYPGIDSTVTVDLWKNVDFSISCNPGFDLGIQSILPGGLLFPGEQFSLNTIAGNTDNWYDLNCVQGVSGQVKITVLGPVTFISAAPNALTPVVTGNTYSYNIANFGAVNNSRDFAMLFKTNTTAHAQDRVCVWAEITTPVVGDLDIFNNSLQFCSVVVNSHDPNMKEVYPVDVVPAYKDWFTYTIHFQNTGNAPAMNIRLTDTLDKNLDLETFQVVNYNHYNEASLKGNALEFKFPNIQLVDSVSDPEGSKGFVQYRVKPKTNLPAGTLIKNKSFIYFDYNPPVITNTTLNLFTTAVSVNENKEKLSMHIYPNPSNGQYFMEFSEDIANAGLSVEVYNVLGSVVFREKATVRLTSIDLNRQPNGVYFIKVTGSGQSYNQRLIKQ
jgi:uncharacterized repeat protein (TIGR01451 family)